MYTLFVHYVHTFNIILTIILGRMALLVTLFLVLVNIFNTVTTNTPKAEGLTAIEAWMLSCILFVFATLVEYACLLFSRDNYVNLDENADDHDWIPETDPCRYGCTNLYYNALISTKNMQFREAALFALKVI